MAKKKRSKVKAALWADAQNAQPEELRGLLKYLHEDKMGIVPAHYIHEKARRDKIPEGCVNRSRRRRTEEEFYLQQLVEYERTAIENGARTWDEIPKETQKLMEERLLPETIAKLKGAKNPITDEGLKTMDAIEGLMFIFTTVRMLDLFRCSTVKELHVLLNLLRKQKVIHYWCRFEDDESYLVDFAT